VSHVVIDHGHATDILARPLSHAQAHLITGYLHLAGIPALISVDRDGLVQLWPERALETVEQVAVYRVVAAVSDSQFARHGRGSA
jgi:hypothetical protein